MGGVRLCRDGVMRVRVRDGEGSRLTPIQETSPPWGAGGLIGVINSEVTLDEGLTVLELMENFSPWPAEISALAGMDFQAWITEARTNAPPADDISHVLVSRTVRLSPTPSYERESTDEVFDPGAEKVSGTLDIDAGWDCCGVLSEKGRAEYPGETRLSLTFCNLGTIANVPVVISDRTTILDETAYPHNAAFMGFSAALTEGRHPFVKRRVSGRGVVMAHEISALSWGASLNDAIIIGLLSEISFEGSPSLRDETAEELRRRIGEIGLED